MRRDDDNSVELMVLRECAKCGKKFYPAPYHQLVSYEVNRKANGYKKKYYCKPTCYLHRNEKQDGRRNGKRVLMYDYEGNFIAEFANAQQAAIRLVEMGFEGASNRGIQSVCRGEAKTLHGYIFKYKE
jgi:hypothetical protein